MVITRNMLLVGLAITGAGQVGCARDARYPLRLYDLNERQQLEMATTVVVGTAIEAHMEPARQEIRWSRQPGVDTARLVRVKLAVEHVICGPVDKPELTVYYWMPELYTTGAGLHSPDAVREVHYLVRDQGVLRYVTDLMRGTTRVCSGYHRQLPKAVEESPEAKIAAVLLTPGEKMDVEDFIRHLSYASFYSVQAVGYVRTIPFLETLAKSPVWDIRWAACVQLKQGGFIGQDGCIDKLASEAIERGREAELRKLQSQRKAAAWHFRQAFLSDPIRTAKNRLLLPGEGGIADFLKMLTQHPDKQIAARAQDELRTCCRSGSK